MTITALVVEDDPGIVNVVGDLLYSIGHEYVSADNLQDARAALAEQDFAYVLLDLGFPTKPNRGLALALKENGYLFLETIQQTKGVGQVPVVIMSGHVAYCLNRSNELRQKGATEFIAKPFPDEGRTLAMVIRDVMAGRERVSADRPKHTGSPRPFPGGVVTLFSNRIDVCGVDILISKLMRKMLDVLNSTLSRGDYAAFPGDELGDLVGCTRGQNGIAESIRDFRNRTEERLLEEANITCHRFDIIRSGGPGYRLNPKIKIHVAGQPSIESSPKSQVAHEHVVSVEDSENDRQRWILKELEKGTEIRAATVALRCGCSPATAKRELAKLRKQSLIRFDGPSKTGSYRLAKRQCKELS
jgi:CheY-like chemotaxis protein